MGVPAKRGGKGKASKSSSQSRQLSAEDYFMEAEVAYFSDDIEGAREAFKHALALDSENEEYLNMFGAFLCENGPRDEALAVLQKTVDLYPDKGFEKYMYLGQVLDSADRTKEAEASMRRGIQLLRAELGEMNDQHAGHPDLSGCAGDEAAEELAEDREHLREALSSALCSLSELLMGAAADEAADEGEDAVAALAASPELGECEGLLGEARELWPKSPEPLQALCSLRRLQGREEEGLQLLRQSLSMWYRPSNDSDNDENDDTSGGGGAMKGMNGNAEEKVEDQEEEDVPLPSYEFRFEAAKLLLELEETTEMAADVLEGLLQENDTVPDVWLLLAVAYRSGGELEAAADAAKEGAATARKLGYPTDHEVVAALSELEEELGKMVLHDDGTGGGGVGRG